jgi:hypothetical protein
LDRADKGPDGFELDENEESYSKRIGRWAFLNAEISFDNRPSMREIHGDAGRVERERENERERKMRRRDMAYTNVTKAVLLKLLSARLAKPTRECPSWTGGWCATLGIYRGALSTT